MITWPAIIKHEGEDELTFIPGKEVWESDPDHFHSCTEEDVLIDLKGVKYKLRLDSETGVVDTRQTGEMVSLEEFEAMLKNHLVRLNQCCIAKFFISSFEEGMGIIENTNE